MRWTAILFLGVVWPISLWTVGCAPAEPKTASAEQVSVDGSEVPDPVEAIARWRRWRDEKRYRLIERCIETNQRKTFVDTLICVDAFLAANEQVQKAIGEVLGDYRTDEWDLSLVGEHLGLFSAGMEILRVDQEADRVTISYQVGGRLPLETASLRAGPEGWTYVTGPGAPGFPAAIRGLAMTLSDIAESIRRKGMTREHINQEFRLRIWPRLMKTLNAGLGDSAGT